MSLNRFTVIPRSLYTFRPQHTARARPGARTLTSSSHRHAKSTSQTPKPSDTPLSRPVPAQQTGARDRLSFWPFLFIFVAGTGLFALTVRSREGKTPKARTAATQPAGEYAIKKKKERDYSSISIDR